MKRMTGVGRARAARRAVARGVLLLAVTAAAPSGLDAQWTIHVAVGARYGSALVRDSIVNPITVAQDLGATLAVGLTTPAPTGWSGEAVLDGTWSGLRREEAGATVDLGGLATVTFTVAVRRELATGLAARAGAGAILYAPEMEAGVFASGAGGATPLGLVGLTFAPSWGRRWSVALDLRYDVHRFLTPALRQAGFDEGKFVHRVALAIRGGARRGR